MAEDNHQQESAADDEMRLCPTCRMKVSVWATKCHYCGEEVGRPRREELKLTIRDLGGGEKTTYAPSGNVTGALESFRAEEVSATEAFQASRQKIGLVGRLLGKRPTPPPRARATSSEHADLDAYSRNLSASILDDIPTSSSMSISRSQLPPKHESELGQRFKLLGGAIVVVVALYFGGNFAWAKINNYIDARNDANVFVYTNRALEMLARGDEPIVAFEEAMTAVGHNNTEENRRIANDIRELVFKQVGDLMDQNPWRREDHDQAFNIILRAMKVDNSGPVKRKYESVASEINLFKFILKSVNSDATEATFRLNNANFAPETMAQVADRIMDRFIVVRITSHGVDLNDDRVPGRKLTIGLNEGVSSRY